MQNKGVSSSFCPYFHQAVELIGRRWTGIIIQALLGGAKRFSDLRVVPDMSDRMLSERLKELEACGIVVRTVIPETPVRIEYSLTPKGQALAGVVDAVGLWAHTWLANEAPAATPPPCAEADALGEHRAAS